MTQYLIVLAISALPFIELRGSIPYGLGMGLDPIPVFLLSLVGNCLPVPFILFFVKRVLGWMATCRVSLFNRVSKWITGKAEKNFEKVQRYTTLGLYLFVTIPLMGTGAWTGALVAALLGMKKSHAFLSIFLGVLTAGILVSLIAGGVLGGLEFLL